MKSAYHFFLKNAGYSWIPDKETEIQGRRRCAKALAAAEKYALNSDYSFEWEIDPHVNSSDFDDSDEPWELYECRMYDENGEMVSCVGGVDFGRDGSPWGDPYRRVIEAELACEVMHA